MAQFVEVAMWVLLVVCVVGGLVIAFRRDPACPSGAGCAFSDRYPLFGLGIGLTIGGILQCLLIIMVAAYIRARADGSIR